MAILKKTILKGAKGDVAVECGLSAQTIENSLYRLLAMTEAEKSTRIEKGVLICEKYSWSSAMQMQKQVYNDVLSGGRQWT